MASPPLLGAAAGGARTRWRSCASVATGHTFEPDDSIVAAWKTALSGARSAAAMARAAAEDAHKKPEELSEAEVPALARAASFNTAARSAAAMARAAAELSHKSPQQPAVSQSSPPAGRGPPPDVSCRSCPSQEPLSRPSPGMPPSRSVSFSEPPQVASRSVSFNESPQVASSHALAHGVTFESSVPDSHWSQRHTFEGGAADEDGSVRGPDLEPASSVEPEPPPVDLRGSLLPRTLAGWSLVAAK